MSAPRITAIAPGSAADRAGLQPGDELVTIAGRVPRDVLEYQWLVDEADLALEVQRGGLALEVEVPKAPGEPLGAEIHSALFDRVRTCDNHCDFCFIYQLPKGMRRSLYLKDDDYRLSFLYGNFTTLTRFTEADLERVVTERLSPLFVSIHATDPDVRSAMLRNPRGATSLRWLRALLDHDIEVHGQIVVCPDVNDGAVLHDTLAGILDRYPDLATLCVVPLGVSRHATESTLRPHTGPEAAAVLDAVHDWQEVFLSAVGHRLVHAADEYYLLADEPFPPAERYEGFPMHEDGVGMARTFEAEFRGQVDVATGVQRGFFAWVDGAPAAGYRAPRSASTGDDQIAERSGSPAHDGDRGAHDGASPVTLRVRNPLGVTVLTGTYGAQVLGPLLHELGRPDVELLAVPNRFFGGNIGVTGLLVGEDLTAVLRDAPRDRRYLLPDVCLTEGRFLDGLSVADLPRHVEVLPTDGHALRLALQR